VIVSANPRNPTQDPTSSPGQPIGSRSNSSRGDNSYIETINGVARPKQVVLIFPPYASGDTGRFAMWINPDQLEIKRPTRAQAVQVIGGAYIDSFGFGLPTGSISGSFGWGKDLSGKTGIERMLELKDRYEHWQDSTVSPTGPTDCELLVPMDHISWLVFWGDLTITRSKQSPNTINYSLPFTVIFDQANRARRPYFPALGIVTTSGGTPPVKEPEKGPGSENKAPATNPAPQGSNLIAEDVSARVAVIRQDGIGKRSVIG
jgi:hypothetical protein